MKRRHVKKDLAGLPGLLVHANSLFLVNINNNHSWFCGLAEYNLNNLLNCRISAL
jgi:hypothetical protein